MFLKSRCLLISIVLIFIALIFLSSCGLSGFQSSEQKSPVQQIPYEDLRVADFILLGAKHEVDNETRYDDSYVDIEYPGGDVQPDVGACTDVVIRAFRRADIDLQKRIHEDMQNNFELYPQLWDAPAPDSNIDHRRVANQMKYFDRHGESLTLQVEGYEHKWQWGDVVYWRFADGRTHCGIISDRTNDDDVPLVIHNAKVTIEEDCLLRWEIIGHYRYPR